MAAFGQVLTSVDELVCARPRAGRDHRALTARSTRGEGRGNADEVLEVQDVPERARYEASLGGELAGFADDIRPPDLQVFTHTEVDPAHEGRGIGGALARGGLDDARVRELAVLPICPFITSWIQRHPDYHDLVYRPKESRVVD